ncbi:MAG: acetamidase/formamidase family protein [Firmicutes bacterium]|nr:acetamidase/formamidase family protein [Bacillota bacterium]
MAKLIIPREAKFYEFTPSAIPVATCHPGDRLVFETTEAPDGQLRTEHDLITMMDPQRANPTTGPVAVVGCGPGDTLAITIEEIHLEGPCFMGYTPSCGVLADLIAGTATKILPIKDGQLQFGRFPMPLHPMIGVIGTTPVQPAKTNSFGPHGGNMDNRKIGVGARVFLPVFVEGALFGLGDLHASMGDGEVCGCGVEVAGEVEVMVDVLKGFSLGYPMVETDEELMVAGEGGDLFTAIRIACGRMHTLLMQLGGLSSGEAYFFLSAFSHVEVCQCAFCYSSMLEPGPRVSVRVTIPKVINLPKPSTMN